MSARSSRSGTVFDLTPQGRSTDWDAPLSYTRPDFPEHSRAVVERPMTP